MRLFFAVALLFLWIITPGMSGNDTITSITHSNTSFTISHNDKEGVKSIISSGIEDNIQENS